jgi:hypothetical protein
MSKGVMFVAPLAIMAAPWNIVAWPMTLRLAATASSTLPEIPQKKGGKNR